MTQMIYAGQGPLYIGDYDATTGRLKNQRAVGCGNRVLKIAMARETAELKESCSGSRLTLAEYETSKSATASLEMHQFDEGMLALALYGTADEITGAAVTGETMPTVAVGDYYHTKHAGISAVVVKDSAGTPATLVLNTHYSIDDANYGRLKILNLASFVQPLKVDYTHATRKNIKPFSTTGVLKGLMFDGFSTIDQRKVRVLLPKISFSPTSEFGFLGDEAAVLTLEGKLLLADVLAADPILGQFGNIELL
jgi:hypothetical protein